MVHAALRLLLFGLVDMLDMLGQRVAHAAAALGHTEFLATLLAVGADGSVVARWCAASERCCDPYGLDVQYLERSRGGVASDGSHFQASVSADRDPACCGHLLQRQSCGKPKGLDRRLVGVDVPSCKGGICNSRANTISCRGCGPAARPADGA